MNALLSEGVATVTPEVIKALSDKHPQKPKPVRSTLPIPDSFVVKSDMVEDCMRSFPSDTGCGSDGRRAQYYIDVLSSVSPMDRESFLVAQTEYCNIVLNGSVSLDPSRSPFFCSAPIIPLGKKDGGIRPIAFGEIDRRLVSKIACKAA